MTDEQYGALAELLRQIVEGLFQLRYPRASYEWKDNKLVVLDYEGE